MIIFESNDFVNIMLIFAEYPLSTNQGIGKSEIA